LKHFQKFSLFGLNLCFGSSHNRERKDKLGLASIQMFYISWWAVGSLTVPRDKFRYSWVKYLVYGQYFEFGCDKSKGCGDIRRYFPQR
jgi:hypothetical protein